MRKGLVITIIMVLASGVLAGCSGSSAAEGITLKMAPLSAMPHAVQTAPQTVYEAYQFNVANPDVMEHFPCYCGCGGIGHTSNYSCYVQDVAADGQVTFDGHALGCGICVDITRDVMRGILDGKELKTIRLEVDAKYSRFGPSTPTGPVE